MFKNRYLRTKVYANIYQRFCNCLRHVASLTVFSPNRKNGAGTYSVCCGPTLKYLPKLKPLMKTMPLLQPLMSTNVSEGCPSITKEDWTRTGALSGTAPSFVLHPVKLVTLISGQISIRIIHIGINNPLFFPMA